MALSSHLRATRAVMEAEGRLLKAALHFVTAVSGMLVSQLTQFKSRTVQVAKRFVPSFIPEVEKVLVPQR